jgi:acetyltransferase-like isoleucine patch superfamily enzyme
MNTTSTTFASVPVAPSSSLRAQALHQVDEIKQVFHFRLLLAEILTRPLPFHILSRVRAGVYRAVGFHNIARRVYFLDRIFIRGRGDIYSNLIIGEGTGINHSCDFDLNGPISFGRNVGVGNHVIISTSSHVMGEEGQRVGKYVSLPVTVGDGAWIGARVTIAAGVTIGAGSMVGVGSVVVNDVPANARVMGNPARVVGWLDGRGQEGAGARPAAS